MNRNQPILQRYYISLMLKLILSLAVIFTYFSIMTALAVDSRHTDGQFLTVVFIHISIYIKTFIFWGLFTPIGLFGLALFLSLIEDEIFPKITFCRIFLSEFYTIFSVLTLIHLLLFTHHLNTGSPPSSPDEMNIHHHLGKIIAEQMREVANYDIWKVPGVYFPMRQIVNQIADFMSFWMFFTNLLGCYCLNKILKEF